MDDKGEDVVEQDELEQSTLFNCTSMIKSVCCNYLWLDNRHEKRM